MGGGLMQLVAYGAQDIYLTGNPQITFFKVVYRRHTNFSMETIQQTINGANSLTATATSTGNVTISRNGDLVSKVWVRCDQDTTALTGITGDKIISQVECEIGGQLIDRHYEEWLQVWAELSTPKEKQNGYKYLTGGFTSNLVSGGGTNQQSIMVPLQFWFCRNPGLALPLIALQYHEVKLKFTWGTGNNVSRGATDVTTTVEVWVDYIYLDTDERRRFAQVSHEYLIEQLQYQSLSAAAQTSAKLNFNHPVKELIWVNTTADITTQKTKLVLNGHDRFAQQDREYFQVRQPLEYHTSVPGYNIKEIEAPVLLGTPERAGDILLTLEADTSPSDGGMAVVTNVLYLHADEAQTTWAVGDIIHVFDLDLNADAAVGFNIFTQITVVTSTTQFTLASCPATVAGAMGCAEVIARTQLPQSKCSQLAKDINVYSFALKPEEHQPSGTCNFSRIDNAKLQWSAATGSSGAMSIYAVNYNVLRIMSGMGGLAYSN